MIDYSKPRLHEFQTHGTGDDYGVFYNIQDDELYFKANIINEVNPGGFVEVYTNNYLYIPPGTLTQRFQKGALATKNKDGHYVPFVEKS